MHNLRKKGLDNVGEYDELEKRKKYAKKFMKMTLVWILIYIFGLVILALSTDGGVCLAG